VSPHAVRTTDINNNVSAIAKYLIAFKKFSLIKPIALFNRNTVNTSL